MSGSIICSVVTPHTPRMGIEAKAPEFLRGVIAGSYALGEELRAMKPDVIVIHSTHWVTTFLWYAACQKRHKGRCVADEAPDLIPGVPYDRPGDPEFGRALVDAFKASEIPAERNDCEYFEWDYGTFVPLQYIDPGSKIPIVLLGTCIMATHDECMRAGAVVRRAAEASGKRVIFISSTALAHKLARGPSLWPPQQHIDDDHKFIELLCAGKIDEAKSWLPAYSKNVVAEMGGRNLATFLGTFDTANGNKYAGRQFGAYGQSSGTGNASVAVWPAH